MTFSMEKNAGSMNSPLVSVIVPCYNEESTITGLLDALLHQTFPIDQVEVVIADGMSTDRTRERITDFQRSHPELSIQLVDNPRRIIPAALNTAIEHASGEFIVRMDGHALPAADYLERCVQDLKAGLGDNVGGVLDVRPVEDSWIGRSIALAAVHPLGVGDARYRHSKTPTEADTVAFGAFHRSLIEKIGKFDETLRVNEDYEFNTRIRSIGGKIWIDPAICAVYFSRPDLVSLGKQYFSYGFWKFRMLQRYPGTIRWRQALPPIFVFGLLMLLLLSVFWTPAWIILASVLLVYLLILAAGAAKPAMRVQRPAVMIGIPLAIATMHICWGAGFWWSLLKRIFAENRNDR